MNAALLDTRVTFLTPVLEQNEFGREQAFSNIETSRWAKVDYKGSSLFLKRDLTGLSIDALVTVRFSEALKEATNIIIGDYTFEIINYEKTQDRLYLEFQTRKIQ